MAKSVSGNDFREHEQTYHAFLGLVKMFVVFMALVLVALYCFIVAHQPWLGLFFLIAAAPGAIVVNNMTSGKA